MATELRINERELLMNFLLAVYKPWWPQTSPPEGFMSMLSP